MEKYVPCTFEWETEDSDTHYCGKPDGHEPPHLCDCEETHA